MVSGRKPTAAEHDRVSAAVLAAEAGTSGEIVTIVSDRSDAYADVGLHYAVLGVLFVPALFAAWPALPLHLIALATGGWGETEPRELMLLAFAVMALVFLVVRYGLAYVPLRLALTPRATRRRRVRRRAVELFRVGAEGRTTARTGILIYLSLGERMAEIVADRAIHAKVDDGIWGDAMAAMVDRARAGQIADGMIAAIERVGAVLAEHLPRATDDRNELPDRLIEI